MSEAELPLLHDVPLASRTTLELGGRAELLCEATDVPMLVRALEHARERGHPVAILGGGSNTIVPDDGVRGLVLVPAMRGIRMEGESAERVRVRVAAGEPWDDFVAWAVSNDLAGVECLSAIPGLVGATPIQNVGAYGQEVSDTIVEVVAIDRGTLARVSFDRAGCRFAYRDSGFKRDPGRFVVVEVVFELRRGGRADVRYAELARALPADASLATVRETVTRLRRAKSMVIAPDDPNRRSAGSFFTNPIVGDEVARGVFARALREGVVAREDEVPRWAAGEGTTKLAAGWLIEKSGIRKGMRRGNVGISTAHALALVHHGGGSTKELLALADEVRTAVVSRFGIALEREPVLLHAE